MSNETHEQRSEEWFKLRRGKPTASKFSVLMAPKGLGVAAQTYAKELVADSILEVWEEGYVSKAMQDGIDLEPFAVTEYEKETMNSVVVDGFVEIPICDINGIPMLAKDGTPLMVGASVDGLVDDDGGTEIKCPQPAKHTQNLMDLVPDKEYIDQLQGCMFITGRKWWDFISYNPNFKPGYKLKVTRVEADLQWQKLFKQRLIEFSNLVEEYKTFLPQPKQ